ncbi:hypothetical protein ACTFIU_001083 [Dictyostelium citrinum]
MLKVVESKYYSSSTKRFLELPSQVNLKNQLSFINKIKEMGIDIISKYMCASEIIKKSKGDCKLHILNYYNSTREIKELWEPIYLSTFIKKFNEKRENTKFAIMDHEIRSTLPPSQTKKDPFIEVYINQQLYYKLNRYGH